MEQTYYQDYFENQADHWWFLGRKKIIFSLLERHVGRDHLRRILDVGCGTGVALNSLQQYGDTLGLDRSYEALHLSRQMTRVPVFQAEFGSLPFKEKSFDLVCAFDILEHLENDKTCVEEAYRLCKPGGHLMVTVPAFQFLWGIQDEISHHKRRYRRGEITRLVQKIGFHPVFASYFNTFLFPPIAFIRGIARYRKPQTRKSDLDIQVPKFLNTFLAGLFGSEAYLMKYFKLPVGVSIVCLAQKMRG